MYKGLYLGSELEELVESGSLLEPGKESMKGGAQGRAGALSCIRRVRRLSLHAKYRIELRHPNALCHPAPTLQSVRWPEQGVARI
jgi:hypothetical protein